MKNTEKQNIALIGFGEAAMTFVKGWGSQWHPYIKAFDIKTLSPSNAVQQEKREDYDRSSVQGGQSLPETLTKSSVVFSLVTADQALIAAKEAANHIGNDALYLDCNSCAPDTKRQSAQIISDAGGRYVDVAVMAPVQADLRKIPLLLSGPHASVALDVLQDLNMSASLLSDSVGDASSVKMMRSIMVKGMEALMMECVLSASKAGVDEIVLNSLHDSFPGFNFKERAAYMMERVMTHGVRRAAEMREVTLSISQLGLDGRMAKATTEWQQQIGELALQTSDLDKGNYQKLANIILKSVGN
ncbi:MAG: DUF1932 domain-containing protein [Emcibacter sp.]|nr:DUF1932 domain-containing protein [Emcibacter sp.]